MADFIESLKQYPLYRQGGLSQDAASEPLSIYFWGTLAFTVFVFTVESYLDFRQLARFNGGPKLPAQLKEFVTDEVFKKSISYGKDKFVFKIIESYFMFIQGILMALSGYLPYAWDLSENIMENHLNMLKPEYSSLFKEILVTWMFLVLMTVVDTVISLPFEIYKTFVLEQKHGFNKSTLGLFVQDKLMTLALTFGVSMPILSIVVWLVRIGGPHFYFYVWVFLCVVSIILMTVFPTVIAPLFNKYTPLEDGEIKQAIEDLAKKVEFPLTQLFSVDGSKRSAHSNAYFYGFFKSKRIVLYDTLLKQVNKEELLAILGHEIGHWKLWHTVQGFFISQLYTFCLFAAFAHVQHTPSLFTAFGFQYSENIAVFVGLMLFSQTFWQPVEKVLQLLMTVNSRANEFAADAFAVSLDMAKPLGSGLIKISLENLDNFVPDKWYSSYHYSHPPLVERLKALNAMSSESKKKK